MPLARYEDDHCASRHERNTARTMADRNCLNQTTSCRCHIQRLPIIVYVARIALLVALAAVLVAAFVPSQIAPSIGGSDWTSHAVAFATLACLSIVAFPERPLITLWLMVSVIGVAIEIVQSWSLVSRGPSLLEAGWNSLVAGGVYCLVKLGGWRSRLRRSWGQNTT